MCRIGRQTTGTVLIIYVDNSIFVYKVTMKIIVSKNEPSMNVIFEVIDFIFSNEQMIYLQPI